MSDLLLNNKLDKSQQKVRIIATARTFTILPQINGIRKGELILFLHDANLINKEDRVIELYGLDMPNINLERDILDNIDLSGTDLTHANIKDASMTKANLDVATLKNADLGCPVGTPMNECTNLSNASLKNADLTGANLTGANLKGAIGTTPDQLKQAKSLHGTIMPDGSKHP
jgi:uncharacterized protein YjbI with pentapeptide repeats